MSLLLLSVELQYDIFGFKDRNDARAERLLLVEALNNLPAELFGGVPAVDESRLSEEI